MKICIGVISYFPDSEIREHRMITCKNAIRQMSAILNLPIIIIAQNWKDFTLEGEDFSNEVCIYKYQQKLGITGARRALRETFLASDYDYMVMLDDDSMLVGTPQDGELYVKQIEQHPNMWGAYKESLLKLFAISKEVFKLIEYPEGEAEHGDFFEDMYMVKACRKLFGNKEFKFCYTNLREVSDSANDANSTWYHKQFNKHDIGDRTRAMIAKLC